MRRTLLALAFATLTLPAHAQTAAPGAPATLKVTRVEDDENVGSLRWAINTNNASPGAHVIGIDTVGDGAIKLRSGLPPIKGPVKIVGAAWRARAHRVAIDGSAYTAHDPKTCPGENAGESGANVRTLRNAGLAFIDTEGVVVQGLEIRNFCIGILVWRTSRSTFEDNAFSRNVGGAGLMLTGDDGRGEPTTKTFGNRIANNVFVGNGDGMEITRGSAFNTVWRNIFSAGSDNLQPSQGIEILRGDDNVLLENLFEGYSDGVQINFGRRNLLAHNVFRGNAFGISATGDGNVISENTISRNGSGVVVRSEQGSAAISITRNRIFGNGLPISRCVAGGSCAPSERRRGIVVGYSDTTPLGQKCDTEPKCAQPTSTPRLGKVGLSAKQLTVAGSVQVTPLQRVTVEIFANAANISGEGESFLAETRVVANAQGAATFSMRLPRTARAKNIVATATEAGKTTSAFSAARLVGGSP